MKALHVTTHMNTGGIACYIASLAKALSSRGVACIVASSGGDLERQLADSGVATIALGIKTKFEFGPAVFRASCALARIIAEEKVNIVHAHTRVAQVASLIATRLTRTPYVTTCHGFFKRRLGRRLVDAWGDRVIAISTPVAESLTSDFAVPAARIERIHTGIDSARFSGPYPVDDLERLKRSIGIEPGMAVVGSIGRLSPVKGHRVMIEAVGELRRSGHTVACLVVGDGPEKDRLASLARQCGVADRIFFVRSTADTGRYLALMDVFVFPSFAEGLGLSLLEAMAAGRACVASAIGGIPDIVTDGTTGVLFPAGNAGRLGDAIVRLLGDGALRERMGAAARAMAQESFSLDTMADKVKDLYQRMIVAHAPKQ